LNFEYFSLNSLFIIGFLLLGIISIISVDDAFASHNPNLIVSAENTETNNLITFPQVIEIVIDDSDISSTTSVLDEPNVTVNGKIVRMVQATDGKWYAYFSDITQAQFADSIVTVAGKGLDFGEFCNSSSDVSLIGVDILQTVAVAIPRPYVGTVSSTNGQDTLISCTGGTISEGSQINHVTREPPTPNQSSGIPLGQIGINSNAFPFIQLYQFNPTGNVIVEYTKDGNIQTTSFDFDTSPFNPSTFIIDDYEVRAAFPSNSDVSLKINSNLMNIDPTDEDSWTFDVLHDNPKLYYQLFDEEGNSDADGSGEIADLLIQNRYDDLGFYPKPFIRATNGGNIDSSEPLLWDFQSNGLQTLNSEGGTQSLPNSSQPITFTETENSSSLFSNTDSSGKSNVISKTPILWAGDNIKGRVYFVLDNNDELYYNLFPPPPEIISDTNFTTDEDTPITIPINTEDVIGLPIIGGIIASLHGQADGTITELEFTPDLNFHGSGSVTLTISNGFTNSETTFSIIVNPINDTPIAGNDVQATTDEDTTTAITLVGQDVDGDSLTYSVETNPTDGTLSGTAPDLSYSPNSDFHGTDSFTFKVNDGTVDSSIETATITISPINDIPIANAGSDQSVNPSTSVTLDGSQSSDVDGDSITYSWIQTSGTPVTLTDDTVVNPQLSTPSTDDTLSFMLTVSDGTATSNPDVVNIYIGSPVPIPIPPSPPTSISTTSSNGVVSLSWQPPTDDGGETITDYIIEFKKEIDTTWQIHDDETTPTTTTTIFGLTNDENYQFRISSVSLAGVGDTSSLVSVTPMEFSTETVEPTVEPTVELSTETVEPKKILSFVDESKEPESYVDRYINEPSYKEWFDSNYSDYTIYEGVGITEDEYLVIVASLEQPVEESLETKEIEEPIVMDDVDLPVVTTPQENTKEIETETVVQDDEPSCGAGTEENSKGQCVPIKSTSTQKSGGGCLIATATYGSELAPQVQQLRELRDNSLLVTKSGTNFMSIFNDVYYSFSPIIADYERENPVFKEMVKVAITPMISSLSILNYVDMDSESSVLGYGISLIVLNLAMYVGIPASVIIGIKKTRN